jgi:hypothetical protein
LPRKLTMQSSVLPSGHFAPEGRKATFSTMSWTTKGNKRDSDTYEEERRLNHNGQNPSQCGTYTREHVTSPFVDPPSPQFLVACWWT